MKNSEKDEDGLTNGLFNPCVNQRSKVLVYIKFQYKNIEKILIYDHTEYPVITLPNDLV